MKERRKNNRPDLPSVNRELRVIHLVDNFKTKVLSEIKNSYTPEWSNNLTFFYSAPNTPSNSEDIQITKIRDKDGDFLKGESFDFIHELAGDRVKGEILDGMRRAA